MSKPKTANKSRVLEIRHNLIPEPEPEPENLLNPKPDPKPEICHKTQKPDPIPENPNPNPKCLMNSTPALEENDVTHEKMMELERARGCQTKVCVVCDMCVTLCYVLCY